MIYSQLSSWNLAHKRVFLRADLNVPLSHGKISNDFRLHCILPTLNFLLKNNAQVILATHLGRPKNKEQELSTQVLLPWFKDKGYTIAFADNPCVIPFLDIEPHTIILLENLRFFPGEKNNDPFFAKELAHTAHLYVNDAFGLAHEHDCSISDLPYEFSENRRTIGFLMGKELSALDSVKINPQSPFVAILGGGKIKEKIPLIRSLIPKASALFLYPALCFSFLKTLKRPIGKSLVDETVIDVSKQIMREAENHAVALTFPIDYQIAYNSINGPLDIKSAENFPDNAYGISIGPKTVDQCIATIKQAKTIFFNCAMGFEDRLETIQSTQDIITAMAQSSAKTIIAGGDSVARALQSPYHDKIYHLSSGGGAALAYISGTFLPGLAPFEEK